MRTQRELQADTDAMKDALFSLNMKLELIRKQNNDLKDQIEEANSRIEELEPLEEENIELREVNNRLTLKMQEMSDDIIELKDQNKDILQIQDETVAEIEKRNAALQEAADMIIRLEAEKATLAQENSQLKGQVSGFQDQSPAGGYAGTDGSSGGRYPSRVYSIDESRPSTSHFDSDYYSQPGSPQVRTTSKESLPSLAFSERAKNFLAMNKEGVRSVQDLKKRASDASMKKMKPKSSIPEVPQIPDQYQEAQQVPKNIRRTPKRHRNTNPVPNALLAESDSAMNASTSMYPPSVQQGLRGMFRDNLTLNTSPRDIRPSSSYANSPLVGRGSLGSRASLPEADRPTPPNRGSSRHAYTSSSNEHLKKDSASDLHTETATETSEWAELPPPPSVVSEDLTTELDFDRRDGWWKGVAKLHNNGRGRDFLLSDTGTEISLAGTAARTALGAPYGEKDFFFNGAEDEEQFMRRVHGYRLGRRER